MCFLVDMPKLLNHQFWPETSEYWSLFLTLLETHSHGTILAYAVVAGCEYGTKVDSIEMGKAISCIMEASSRRVDMEKWVVTLPVLAVTLAEHSSTLQGKTTHNAWIHSAANAIVAFAEHLHMMAPQKKWSLLTTSNHVRQHVPCGLILLATQSVTREPRPTRLS
jgi:hypothetical protein